jgi:hypothetical protein
MPANGEAPLLGDDEWVAVVLSLLVVLLRRQRRAGAQQDDRHQSGRAADYCKNAHH